MEHPTQLIRDEHKQIKGLFRQILVLNQRAHEMKSGLVNELFLELGIHRLLMDEILEPAVMDFFDIEGRGRLQQASEQHHEIREIISELRGMNVDSEDYERKMADLRKSAEFHFEQEEREVLPLFEKVLGDSADEILRKMRNRREQILSAPKFESALPKHVQNPNGGEQKRKAG